MPTWNDIDIENSFLAAFWCAIARLEEHPMWNQSPDELMAVNQKEKKRKKGKNDIYG